MTGLAPMRTLFGYALLRDEHGEEMHKSKGNAIWFDDAAEEIGADVMRWMFSITNPAVNMNFRSASCPRGGASLLPAALEHVCLLRDLCPNRRLDAGSDRWRRRRPDAPGPMDLVPPGCADRRGPRRPGRIRRRSRSACDRGLLRRAVELVRPSQPPALLEGRAGRGQAGGICDAVPRPRGPRPAACAIRPARRGCPVAEPGRIGRHDGRRQRSPRRLPGAASRVRGMWGSRPRWLSRGTSWRLDARHAPAPG